MEIGYNYISYEDEICTGLALDVFGVTKVIYVNPVVKMVSLILEVIFLSWNGFFSNK